MEGHCQLILNTVTEKHSSRKMMQPGDTQQEDQGGFQQQLCRFLVTRKHSQSLWGEEITFLDAFPWNWATFFPHTSAPVLTTVIVCPLSFRLHLWHPGIRRSSCPYMPTVNVSVAPVWTRCRRPGGTLTTVLLWKLPKVSGVVLILVVDNVPVRLVGLDALRRQQKQVSVIVTRRQVSVYSSVSAVLGDPSGNVLVPVEQHVRSTCSDPYVM